MFSKVAVLMFMPSTKFWRYLRKGDKGSLFHHAEKAGSLSCLRLLTRAGKSWQQVLRAAEDMPALG
jgi:hypothetical protein